MLTTMSADRAHIAIDVCIEGDEISGHATDGAGQSKPFSGWLGLIGALDALLTAHTTQTQGRERGS
jgi:hypothetical protein